MATTTVSGIVVADPVKTGFVVLSESAYAALTTKDSNVFYFVYPDS